MNKQTIYNQLIGATVTGNIEIDVQEWHIKYTTADNNPAFAPDFLDDNEELTIGLPETFTTQEQVNQLTGCTIKAVTEDGIILFSNGMTGIVMYI